MNYRRLIPQLLLPLGLLFGAEKQRTLKPGWNLFSPDQDVQMGREYAQEIERQFQIVSDPVLHNYVNEIGTKLMAGIEGKTFPFTFKVVNDPSINAFALPGGPMYVHTGLIAAADNKAQIAGVLGHEMGHVALRHGTNQASKANLIQIPAMIAGGIFDKGGLTGTLTQLGIGLGANGVLMKFSRTAENDSDLFGARLVHKAGYNPVELARFFEKLQAEGGRNGRFAEMFASHPNPGNRIKNIEKDMKFYPQREYMPSAISPQLTSAREVIKRLPAPPKPQQGGGQVQAPQGPPVSINAPQGFRVYQNSLYAIAYPGDWAGRNGQDGVSATVAPQDGIVRGQNGQEDIGHGVILNFGRPQSSDLNRETEQLIRGMQQGQPELKTAGNVQSVRVDGLDGRIVPMTNVSGLRRGERENVIVLTVMHRSGMFMGIFVAPESRWRVAEPEFQEMMRSLRFARGQ
ncbi:MAG: hypothetical protein FJW30_24450 [Acidobacteria bacterium]|nr:hypothetical protein [Acidobacteriota bacterium]